MTSLFGSDRDWRRWGERDPYYAVLTDQTLHRAQLTPEALAAFFRTGEDHVRRTLETIRRHVDPGFRPRRALDFGCGVGRLLLPLAGVAEHVVGVDVSPGMLAEARKQVERRGLANVSLATSDDGLSQVAAPFDLVHSYLVLQHIPVARGERLIARLVDLLAPGGVAVLQLPYAREASPLRRAAGWVRRSVPGVHGVVSLLRGTPWSQPGMQMNLYDLGRVHRIFERAGVTQVHTGFTRDGEYHGVMLFAQRATGSPPSA